MAGGSVTAAALLHRPRQAALIVALAAVVTGAAVMGPLYARAVEQSVLRSVLANAPVGESGVTVLATGAAGERPASPGRLATTVAPGVTPQFGTPIGGADTKVLVRSTADAAASTDRVSRLVSRSGLCRHLRVVEGTCSGSAGDVLVSRRTASAFQITPGDSLRVLPESEAVEGPADAVSLDARVAGVYEPPDPDDPYWFGRGLAEAPTTERGSVDDLLTSMSTLEAQPWPELRTYIDIPIDPAAVDLSGVAAVAAATDRIDRLAGTVDASATSGLAPLLDLTRSQNDHARNVVPLLTVQLAVLGVVVLAFVCAAATEQRRPEIALTRLRGLGTARAGGLLMRELGSLIVLGALFGGALGWLAAAAAAKRWLEPGVVLEARWPALAAGLAATVGGLLAIAVAGAPTLRQPVTSLLRRVPPRGHRLQVGLVEAAVVTGAGAGLVTLLSGEGGPVALLAPGLLAVAGGLLLAQAAIPVAGAVASRSLPRGRLAWALAGVQIARRPALRRLIAIVTVAGALLVFAVDAWAVASRNRSALADVDAGAATVLTVDATSPQQLRDTVTRLDPRGRHATPVVVTRSAAPVGPMTLAVEPRAFARIARWGEADGRPSPRQIAALRTETVAAVPLPDAAELSISVRAEFRLTEMQRSDSNSSAVIKPFRVAAMVGGTAAQDGYLDLGRLQPGARTYTGTIACPDRCTLDGLVMERAFGDSHPADVMLRVREVRAGRQGDLKAINLGPASRAAWQVVPSSTPGAATVDPGPPLTIRDPDSFQSVLVQRGVLPVVPPAFGVGDLERAFRTAPDDRTDVVVAPGFANGNTRYRLASRLTRLPGTTGRAVLVDLDSVVGEASETPAHTSYDVWL
ncbi:MAG: FtsX-like permease family protein, partial [Actinomycetes bacterium]